MYNIKHTSRKHYGNFDNHHQIINFNVQFIKINIIYVLSINLY